MVLFADLLPNVGIGADFIGDDFRFNEDHQVLGEALGLCAAVFWCAWFFLLRCGCFAALFRKRRGLSQHDLIEEELELGGVELLAAGAEEARLETGDDLVLALEFVLEQRDLLLHFAEAKEQVCEIRWGAFIH